MERVDEADEEGFHGVAQGDDMEEERKVQWYD